MFTDRLSRGRPKLLLVIALIIFLFSLGNSSASPLRARHPVQHHHVVRRRHPLRHHHPARHHRSRERLRHSRHKPTTASLARGKPTNSSPKKPTPPYGLQPTRGSGAHPGPAAPTEPGATSGAAGATSVDTPTDTSSTGNTKLDCVYASDHVSLLEDFDQLVGRNVNCAMVYNDASSSWAGWDDPWFLSTYSDMNWGAWATAPGTNRRLIITQNLFPSSEDGADWLAAGAAGDYMSYAATLAENLVAAGLGNAIIRLGHEANGTWYPDSIPNTTVGDAEWVQFWDNTVTAMRSVPGANFSFDWTVNAGYRNIPLSNFYPGDGYVDIIGIDAYDGGDTHPGSRWSFLYNQADGIGAVESFAQAHGKPLSIPEWGVVPESNPNDGGGGDDPAYVAGIASVVADDDVAYQSYFFSGEELAQLTNSPQSLQAYREAFGSGGNALGDAATNTDDQSPLEVSNAPSLTLTGGPAYDSVQSTDTATYTFQAQSGYHAVCSLDFAPWRACTSATSDVLSGLTPGYHFWSVQVSDGTAEVRLYDEDFTVSSSG